jgi:cation diffusion facilitator CzcD-associated flavoprotein CzcO
MESFDVVIIGAGISGIGAAYHLRLQNPDIKFVILESKDHFGGTWYTHTYPGVRSDSDLYTFGYSFKPWTGVPIATGGEIMKYLGDVIQENDIAKHIRFLHKVLGCSYSSEDHSWTVDVQRTDVNASIGFKARFLWTCQGYYDHDHPYTPVWPGMKDFKGKIVHPQHWPNDLDLSGKKVVVIGSGATAATLIPAVAAQCEHVTMLQRSPTYFHPGRDMDELAKELRKIKVKDEWIHEIMRKKILYEQAEFIKLTFEQPEIAKQLLLDGAKAYLGEENQELINKHFTPKYRPWQQRLALIPNGDLYLTIRSGKADVVTDEIETFNENGILTKSGQQLNADVIITATGFNLSFIGSIPFVVDGKLIHWKDTVTYRGMMFTGVPNLVCIFGYIRASWTLRVDLVAKFVCDMLKYMKENQFSEVQVKLRPEEEKVERLPWMDPSNFNSGYFMRGIHLWPQRLNADDWQHSQNYSKDAEDFPKIRLDDTVFHYQK